MRLYRFLNEKYFGRKMDTEVFINPTIKEIMGIGSNDIRFVADNKKKKFYIWDAYKNIHVSIWDNVIGDSNREFNDKTLFTGIAKLKGGKMHMHMSDELEHDKNTTERSVIQSLFENDWDWVDKYIIDFSIYIKKMRESYKGIKGKGI
uniref:Uncharacterized protein n=1 Tax=viral metagenome TaxID=1070528 RepID=A0A6M3K3V2_9ZZZZ